MSVAARRVPPVLSKSLQRAAKMCSFSNAILHEAAERGSRKKIFATFIGLSGCPDGVRLRPMAQRDRGGTQSRLPMTFRTLKEPAGVGSCFFPMPTLNVSTGSRCKLTSSVRSDFCRFHARAT